MYCKQFKNYSFVNYLINCHFTKSQEYNSVHNSILSDNYDYISSNLRIARIRLLTYFA